MFKIYILALILAYIVGLVSIGTTVMLFFIGLLVKPAIQVYAIYRVQCWVAPRK